MRKLISISAIFIMAACGADGDRVNMNQNDTEIIVYCPDSTDLCIPADPEDPPEPKCPDNCNKPNPPTPMPKSNCTLYMGNTQKQDPEKQKLLFAQIEKAQGCVVKDIFHVGDMSYGDEHLEEFLKDFSPVLAKNPQAKFWPARGDEDRMWPESLAILKEWFPHITMEICKSYYVRNGDLTTIVLDSEDYCSYDQQLKMVAENLTGKPVAIVMHGAAITSYDNVATNEWAREKLHNLIKGWNVTVFNGEAKGYERNSLDGVKYVNPGSGGVCTDECADSKSYTVKCNPTYSYVFCTDGLQCSAVDLNGQTIDFF